jgi:hypothetical protein
MSTTDERLERYLHDRSATIDLPHAGVEAITRRARRHRRRRSAALGGAVAAIVLGGTAVVIAGVPDEDVTKTTDTAASVSASPLEWSIVPVQTGIGWGSTAISDGAAIYSLSTAPGPESVDAAGQPRHLYRSEDGTDWESVTLPVGLFPSSVAAEDGTVYAVGTAAAGGETVGVELATSIDGGSAWGSSDVPIDLAALADGFPGRIVVTDAEVATAGGTTVVAVSTSGLVDVEDLVRPDEAEVWFQGRGGLTRAVDEPCTWSDAPAPTTTAPAGAEPPASTEAPTTVAPATTAPPSDDPATPAGDVEAGAEADAPITRQPGASGAVACEGGEGRPPTPERRSWADLGLTPEQAAIADGQTHLFVAGPDGALAPTETIAQASYADPSSSRLLAADDGWWLIDTVVSERDASGMDIATDIVAWHSADGTTWASTPLVADESATATGVLDGRPVVVGIGSSGSPLRVHRIEGPGAVSTVDLDDLLGEGASGAVFASAVGPAGVAVVVGTTDASGSTEDIEVVHSADGVSYGRQPLPEPEGGTRDVVNGVTITPDAIKVRLNVRDAASDGTEPPSAQRLFVGTPAG